MTAILTIANSPWIVAAALILGLFVVTQLDNWRFRRERKRRGM